MAKNKPQINSVEMEHTEPMIYMNPFTDYGFKKLFGEEDSKEFLVDFLNSVLEGFIPHIHELTYHKNEHLGNKPIDRSAIFDLYCKTKEGNTFIIELQKVKQDYFKQKSLFYSTFAIAEQAKRNSWDFKLNPVYCIGILNFSLGKNSNKYITKAKILDIETQEIVIEELNFAFIECPKFNKIITKYSSRQDKWLYILSHLHHLQSMPKELSEKLFEEFFTKANILKLSSKERSQYNASITYSMDIQNVEKQNFAKGKLEGVQEGIQQGIQQEKINIIKQMKKENISIDVIQKLTGLTDKDIDNIN